MLTEKPVAAVVQQAEMNEEQLIEAAQRALSSCNWSIGKYASEWTERFSRGRTDAEFGASIGMSGDQVRQRRATYQRFGGISDTYPNLKWSHFYIALTWEDATECLQWANEIEATVAEMKAWRRAKNGEDLTQPAIEDNEDQFCESDPGAETCQGGSNSSEAADTAKDGMGRDRSDSGGSVGSEDTQEGQVPGGFGESEQTRHRPTPVNKSGESKPDRVSEVQTQRSPARAKREPEEDGGGTAESAASRNVEEASPPRSPDNMDSYRDLYERMSNTLERMTSTINKEVFDNFPELPNETRQRFTNAVKSFRNKIDFLG